MAQRLDRFDFDAQTGGREKYPWADWMDGSIWEVQAGSDFAGTTESMRAYLHVKAQQADAKVRTRVLKDPDRIVFQFFKA